MEWFESEDFWTNYSPIMFDENRWAEAPAVADYVKKIARLNDGDTVLDAGCGIGRISVELATLNLKVTGVDIIQSELDAAADMADAEGVPLCLVKADLRNFIPGQNYNATQVSGGKSLDFQLTVPHFDCAVNLFTSFGYCGTIEEDMKILKNICECLKKGGIFIMECLSREVAQLYFTPGEEFDRAGMHVITKFSPEKDWQGLRSQWTLISPNGKKINHVFTQRLYAAQDLISRCILCGFSSAKVYGDFDFSPYDKDARTMVLVAVK